MRRLHNISSLARQMRMMRSRKGFTLSYKMLMWVPRFLFAIIVIGLNFYVIYSFIVTRTNIYDAESKILAAAPYYSEKGFSVFDAETGRVYPGVIDAARFGNVKGLLGKDKPLIVGRFVRRQMVVDYRLNPQPDSPTAYTDQERYERWQPIAQAGGEGEGGKTAYPDIRYAATLDPVTGKRKGSVVETVFIASG